MCGLSFSWFFSRLLIKALPTLLEQWNLHKNPESYSFLGGVCFHSWNHTSAEDPPFQRRFATLSMQSTISKYCRSKNLGWAICWKGETRIILRSFCLVFDKTRFLDIKCWSVCSFHTLFVYSSSTIFTLEIFDFLTKSNGTAKAFLQKNSQRGYIIERINHFIRPNKKASRGIQQARKKDDWPSSNP